VGCGGPFRSSSLRQVGAQGRQFDADKTVRLHVVSDPAADNRLRPGPACRALDVSPSSTCLRPARAVLPSPSGLLNSPAPSPRDRLTISSEGETLNAPPPCFYRRHRAHSPASLREFDLPAGAERARLHSPPRPRSAFPSDNHVVRFRASYLVAEVGVRDPGFVVLPAESGHPGRNPSHSPPCSSQGRLWTPAFRGSDDSGDMRLRRSLIYATWY
jgi:hypothetical protein